MPLLARSTTSLATCLLTLWPLAAACSSGTPPSTGDSPGSGGTGGKALTAGMSGSAGRAAGGTAGAGGAGGSGGLGAGGSSAAGGVGGGSAGTASGGTSGSPSGGLGGSAGAVGGVGGTAGLGVGGSVAGMAQGGTGFMEGGAAGGLPMAGSGGVAGAAAGGMAGAGGGKATGFFTDDFEAGTTGMQPPGWDNFISYNKNATNPSGMNLALVDTVHVHGGTKAAHFKSDGSPVQLAKALTSGMNKLYIRVWVYMTRKLGQQTDMGANHETLIALRQVSGMANDEVRFGEIKGTVGVNEVPSDNIAPTMDKWHQATGPLVPANTWACIEVAFLADSSPNTLKSWQNGATLFDVTSVGKDQWQNNPEPADWLATKFGGSPSEIVIGWQSFSSAANELWLDDLILSTSPIGCN